MTRTKGSLTYVYFKEKDSCPSVDQIVEKLLAAFPDIRVTSHDFYADQRQALMRMIADFQAKSGKETPDADRLVAGFNAAAEVQGTRKRFAISVPGADDLIGDISASRLVLVSDDSKKDSTIRAIIKFLESLGIVERTSFDQQLFLWDVDAGQAWLQKGASWMHVQWPQSK